MPWRKWLKWLVVVDLDRQLVLAQRAHSAPTNDGATLRPLLDTAHSVSSIALVLADAEVDSELNHSHICEHLHARSVIPTRRGKPRWKTHGVRAQMRANFPRHLYCRRAPIETTFSTTERTFGARSRPMRAYSASPSPAARTRLQPLPPLVRPSVLEEVDRAT
jgi:hypothetical protein